MTMSQIYNPHLYGPDSSARYVENKKMQLKQYFKPGSWFVPVGSYGDPITSKSYQVQPEWLVGHYGDRKFFFMTSSGDGVHAGFIYANTTMAKLIPPPLANSCPTREELERRYPVGTCYTPVNVIGDPTQFKVFVTHEFKLIYNNSEDDAYFVNTNPNNGIPGYIWTRYEGVDYYAKVNGGIDITPTLYVAPEVKEEKPLVVERPPLKLISVPFRKL